MPESPNKHLPTVTFDVLTYRFSRDTVFEVAAARRCGPHLSWEVVLTSAGLPGPAFDKYRELEPGDRIVALKIDGSLVASNVRAVLTRKPVKKPARARAV